MKSLDDEESIAGSSGSGKPVEGVAGSGTGSGSVKPAGEGVVEGRVGAARVKPKGSMSLEVVLCRI